MTQERLRQLPWLLRERQYQETLCQDPLAQRRTGGMLFGKRLTKEEGKILEQDTALCSRAREIARRALEKRLDETERLFAFIEQVEDSEMRMLLTKRFVEQKSWQSIGFEMGAYDESVPRKKVQRFLRSTEHRKEVEI